MKPFDCDRCGAPIGQREVGTWMKVTGWVEVRKDGASGKIVMPSSPVAFRCYVCMMIAKTENKGEQNSLF